jgi:sporulation protein YlmC with PRC-barrel domain
MGFDRSAMTPVSTDQLSADNLIGRTVYSANDENIGEVGDVLLTSDNKVEGFILDVGGFPRHGRESRLPSLPRTWTSAPMRTAN